MSWNRRSLLGMKALFALLLCLTTAVVEAAELKSSPLPQIGTVSFRKCFELSKLGKREQASFDAMKRQMETALQEKEKELTDVAGKLNDPDYLDSLNPDKENELKHKFRMVNQELSTMQNQFMQTLQQANVKIVQQISDEVNAIAAEIAKQKKFELLLNEESFVYASSAFDISDLIVQKMDQKYDRENGQ